MGRTNGHDLRAGRRNFEHSWGYGWVEPLQAAFLRTNTRADGLIGGGVLHRCIEVGNINALAGQVLPDLTDLPFEFLRKTRDDIDFYFVSPSATPPSTGKTEPVT